MEKLRIILKNGYRIVRSILFTAIALLAFIYISLYLLLSMPAVQNKIRTTGEQELTTLFQSQVKIEKINLAPFNELTLENVSILTPEGEKCIDISLLGAGISLWDLIAHQEIIITYAEVIGLDGYLWQQKKDSPLNIQFMIDAFAPKEKNKPPVKFRLDIRNIVIRRSSFSFDRRYVPNSDNPDRIDFNHLKIKGLSADLALPVVSNDTIDIDLRRLALTAEPGLDINHLSLRAKIEPQSLSLKDFRIELPETLLKIADLKLDYPSIDRISEILERPEPLQVSLFDSRINPRDFSAFLPELKDFDETFNIGIEASLNQQCGAISKLQLSSTDNDQNIDINGLEIRPAGKDKLLTREGISNSDIILRNLTVSSGQSFADELAEEIPADRRKSVAPLLRNLGKLRLHANGEVNLAEKTGLASIRMNSGIGDLEADISSVTSAGLNNLKATIDARNLDLAAIPVEGLPQYATLTADLETTLDFSKIKQISRTPGFSFRKIQDISSLVPSLKADITIPEIRFNGNGFRDISIELNKLAGNLTVAATSPTYPLDFSLLADASIGEPDLRLNLTGVANHFKPRFFKYGISDPTELSGIFSADISGTSIDELTGEVTVDDFIFEDPLHNRTIDLKHFNLISDVEAGGMRTTDIHSDWLQATINTDLAPSRLPEAIMRMAARITPLADSKGIYSNESESSPAYGQLTFSIDVDKQIPLPELGIQGYRPLHKISLDGDMDFKSNSADISLNAPYIQQGKDKLIRETKAIITSRDNTGEISIHSIIPTKKGDLDLNADIAIHDMTADLNFDFNPGSKGGFYGQLALTADYQPALNPTGFGVRVKFHPTSLYLNSAEWKMGEAQMEYADRRIDISNFSLGNSQQYITINGSVSESPDDKVVVNLSQINLDYIFDTLNINYVNFGGTATGTAYAAGVFSPTPVIETSGLRVKDLAYNNCVLGDGDLHGDFDLRKMRVGINASVKEKGRHVADIDGGIWIGRDSLSFSFDTDKVKIGFLQTFMQAFSSKVEGRASGKGVLAGTFHDIDMTGRFYADTIAVKVDYTNVTYSGRDSVILTPGRIDIPAFTLRDPYGNTAVLSGNLRHHYFHEPYFNFYITDARSMLVYNTDESMNNIWYGRIFGNGGGSIIGTPSLVEITADMTTVGDSDFTFVLDDTMEAENYTFLSFTDTHREMMELMGQEKEDDDDIVSAFRRRVETAQQEEGSAFAMNIRAQITPAVKMNLVMDPAAGDRITARGSGPLNLTYRSEGDEMRMYGKYTLEEGKYNFTLQDIILKDFIIKEGSSVSFNGDPMNANLDIKAAYRVNTNLTDLDKSFATDRDLNRTNVPVDAMLLVKGDMTNPDISFDIEFPTLNDEVARKVRSIISSEDMMNRQMIYLLALNRFYTPEYMGSTSNGGEWASVASSTLSSQLQNILGKLTDKFSLAPSLRSDKGDFSDLEFDVALSSQLFNNRLLINGNLGYRDKSTSSTTFVGDFDIEYLLTRNGNIRLKAYNHFNDQNYYLKSALTTQGIGLIFRKDFGDLIPRKKMKKEDRNKKKKSGNDSLRKNDSKEKETD